MLPWEVWDSLRERRREGGLWAGVARTWEPPAVSSGPQYGSLERAWGAIMTEADKVSELHQEMKNSLLNEDLEKVKNWQKEAYHKQRSWRLQGDQGG